MTTNGLAGLGTARRALGLITIPALLLTAACQDGGITDGGPDVQLGIHQDVPLVGSPDASFETLTICKQWTNAADISVDFDVTLDPDDSLSPPQASTQTRTLTDTGSAECRSVALFDGLSPTDLNVVEIVPSGASLLDVQLETVVRRGAVPADYSPTTDVAAGTFSATGADNNVGFKVTYVNELVPVEGGEGCTPGYWKNPAGVYSHSKGGQKKPSAWQVYSPLDGYDATFGVSSSFNSTLIAALNRGGGGENALGRHAVAALLNAAHSGVDYAFTTAEVIALVQGAYASGDFTDAKDQLATENEQGCPL